MEEYHFNSRGTLRDSRLSMEIKKFASVESGIRYHFVVKQWLEKHKREPEREYCSVENQKKTNS